MQTPLGTILNFRQISQGLATGGQPDTGELVAVCQAGYEVVINLGLHEAPYALPDEARLVRAQGVEYHHLPVDFQQPAVSDFFSFLDLMRRLKGRKCFIHCAANKRVSCFMALYRIIELGWTRHDAEASMRQVWEPEPAWKDFMDRVLEQAQTSPP